MASVNLYFSTDFRFLDISTWQYLVPTSETSTFFTGYYSFDPNAAAAFAGTGFTYSSGIPVGGTVNQFYETYYGALVYNVQNVAIPVPTLMSYSAAGDTAGALVTVLAGADSIFGSMYDDFVYGLGGDDSIDGSNGIDAAAYAGPRMGYSVTHSDGYVVVTDVNPGNGNEGTDRLFNVEYLSFSDATIQTNTRPVVTASDLSVSRGATVAASSLFSYADADADAATLYQFWDGNAGATSGYFTVNGITQAANESIQISAGQLSQTAFHASGSDLLWVRAYDGYGWGNWASFTVTAPVNHAPVTVAGNQTVGRAANVAATSLFSVSDADGDTITTYQFWDSTADAGSGHFVVNGVSQGTGVAIDVTAADLAATSFQAGVGTDHLWVRAFDGFTWSAWDPFDVTAPANTLPVVTVSNKAPGHGVNLIVAASLFSYSDADGDAAARYQFWDSGTAVGSGYFTVGGAPQATNTAIDIAAADLGTVAFQLGSTSDLLWVRASDGIGWGEWKSFTVAAPANQTPTVAAPDVAAARGQSLAAASLFSYGDADGDSAVSYQFWDSTSAAASGHFVVNGVAKATNVAIDVAAADLANTTFEAGTVSDHLWVRAFDGTAWSAWDAFDVSIPPNALPVMSVSNISPAHGATTLAGSSLFSYFDANGDAATHFQFWDSGTATDSGYFTVGGVRQATNTAIDVAAGALGSVAFQLGSTSDMVWVRASDGFDWGEWKSFTIAAPANAAPTVTVSNVAATHGEVIAASDLFEFADADNDAALRFQFWDSTAAANSGHFEVNGVAQASNVAIDVAAADLANTSFATGSGTDHLWVRAFDGAAWSDWKAFDVAAPVNGVPTASVAESTQAVAAGTVVGLPLLFAGADPDGDAISFRVWDSTADGASGHFELGGVAQPTNVAVDVSAADYGTGTFVAGTVGDQLWVQAYDGIDYGSWVRFDILIA